MFNDEQINLILQALHLSEDAILFNVEQFMTQMFIRLSDIKVTFVWSTKVFLTSVEILEFFFFFSFPKESY